LSVRSFFRPLYSPAQMRAIDSAAIRGLGIPSLELMENAGRGAAAHIDRLHGEWNCEGAVLVLCGAGNNGGDGLVVARYLADSGHTVQVWVLAPESKLNGDPAVNLKRLRDAGIEPRFEPSPADLSEGVGLIVDALLGTGSTGALREPYAQWAEACNASGLPVVAMDAPSGVDLADGTVSGTAFRAWATLALAELKHGYFQQPGRQYAGRVYLVDIGIPGEARSDVRSDQFLITPEGVRDLLPERSPIGHKGTFGRVAVIGGSQGMTGAVILASLSALKSGCGLVTLGVPEGLNDICESSATEVITRPLPQVKSARALATRATGEASRLCGDAAACVVGCGGGRHHETQELFTRLLERNETPLILDADGLYPFGADPDRLVRHRAPLCITPHAGELARLLHLETEEVQADRIGSALRAARHFDCVCVLKGALTVVATITGQVYLNPTGNSGMGTAGSGDVLAGLIGSLLAQGMSVLGAATAGVFVHGLAGDLAAEMQGERGLLASDIMAELPDALQYIAQGSTHPGY
jgi:hydroxyethylthiazole kinase-like uncharacterized protein yjeF